MAESRGGTADAELDDLVRELSTLRAKGLHRHDELELPVLRHCVTRLTGHQPSDVRVHHLEAALQAGMHGMGEGDAAECAAVLFGMASHVRGLHPIELRQRAAELYYDRTAVDAFRKTRERRILTALAIAMLRAVERPIQTLPAQLPRAQLDVDQPGWRPRTTSVLVVEPDAPGQLRELTWAEFGQGLDVVRDQIRHFGSTLDIDMAIGINEAGLVMATFLASATFGRCSIGYVRTRSKGKTFGIDDDHSHLGPQLATAAAVLICDYEVKTTPVLPRVCDYLHDAGLNPTTPRYFAVMGALATTTGDLDGTTPEARVTNLACQPVLGAARLTDAFIGCLMASPGIDPPLALR